MKGLKVLLTVEADRSLCIHL